MVRFTDRPDMTLDVYRGRKTTLQQRQQQAEKHSSQFQKKFSTSHLHTVRVFKVAWVVFMVSRSPEDGLIWRLFAIFLNVHMNIFQKPHTVELQWLEHPLNHEKMFETGVVRANEC